MRRIITVAALLAAFLVPTIASAFHSGEVVVGRYRLPKDHRFESPNAQGKYEVVDINDVPRLIRDGRFVFDRTGNAWIAKPGGGPINAAYLASGASSTAAASSPNSSEWQQIHGRVESVTGSSMTLHADDNRRLTVDMSKVGSEIQKNLQRGDRVTVATHEVSGTSVKAEFIQKDSSAGAQPSASPSTTPVDEKNSVVIGRFRLPKDHRFESPNAQGKYEVVDINQVPELIRQGRFVFDRTGNTWIARPGGGPINPAYLASGASSPAAASSPNSAEWQQIHGRVVNVNGSTMTLHADDNRRLTVDMSKVGSEIQKNLQRGDRVTVATHEVAGTNVKAESIQKDSSAGVPPAASPSTTPVDEKNWQKIHGKVTSVSGDQLMLKADDGRDLTVDMKEVNPAVQKALTPGEGVTVAGFYQGGDKNVSAKFIQQDSSAK